MLEFAALHNIETMVSELPMIVEGIEEAFEKLESGEMRYPGVLISRNI